MDRYTGGLRQPFLFCENTGHSTIEAESCLRRLGRFDEAERIFDARAEALRARARFAIEDVG